MDLPVPFRPRALLAAYTGGIHFGDWVALTSFRDWNNEIYRMRPDGSEETRLAFDPRPDWQPRWGP